MRTAFDQASRTAYFGFTDDETTLMPAGQRFGLLSGYEPGLKEVLQIEGGNDDDPQDPGGRTSRGILQREWDKWRKLHPDRNLPSDVWQAPQSQIVAIYKEWYWDAILGDQLPGGLDVTIFDYGINSGIGRAAKVLRRLLGLSEGTVINPYVLSALKGRDIHRLIDEVCDERVAFLKALSRFPRFGKGWLRRVAELRINAHRLVAPVSHPQVPAPTVPPDVIIKGGVSAGVGGIVHWFTESPVVAIMVVVGVFIVATIAWSWFKKRK